MREGVRIVAAGLTSRVEVSYDLACARQGSSKGVIPWFVLNQEWYGAGSLQPPGVMRNRDEVAP